MSKVVDFTIPASEYGDGSKLPFVLKKYWKEDRPFNYRIIRKSIDSRQRTILFNLRVELLEEGEKSSAEFTGRNLTPVPSGAPTVHIAGTGPAGLFAAIRLIEHGIKPVLLERGKDVRSRRRDLAQLNKEHIVNPESNYCFGEGGAGTYSDGKLYTRSSKRGSIERILQTFVEFGANENILSEAHPHIGTNKLPDIITSMREAILAAGGEVLFNHKLTDLKKSNGRLSEIQVNSSLWMPCEHLILATGHSASDVFRMLHKNQVSIEFKSFALGVRIEHPQELIDSFQYRCKERPEYLPAAAYSLVEQIDGRGVYSFCMCPGGIIAPCATEPGQVVTNGWSPSKRNNPWANSGIVVPVYWEDIPEFHASGPLAGLDFQRSVEEKCWEKAGKTQAVPAQRVVDFIEGKLSKSLPDCSYIPGLSSQRLDEILPAFIAQRLKKAFQAFGKKIPGYLTSEAIIVAPESRTSSPVRVPRDNESCEHPELAGLYPCGEGAGYAGGIVSAAMDGEKVAHRIAVKLGINFHTSG